jgi:hypothetical protein
MDARTFHFPSANLLAFRALQGFLTRQLRAGAVFHIRGLLTLATKYSAVSMTRELELTCSE